VNGSIAAPPPRELTTPHRRTAAHVWPDGLVLSKGLTRLGRGAKGRVADLKTACEAIKEIVVQGEGEVTEPPAGEKFDAERDLAHFYRFNELRRGHRYRVGDFPADPTGEPIVLDLEAVYPMKPNLHMSDIRAPELRRLAEACNRIWSSLLRRLETALTGSPEELRTAVGTMFELKYAACELLRIPLPDDAGLHAGPTFEVVP
jgi:Ferritin-like